MNKAQKIAFYRRQVNIAKEMQSVAQQNYSLAARLESEAKSALDELGAQKERPRKGVQGLSEKVKLQLKAGLTNKKTTS